MAENTTEITDVEGDETPMTSYTSESAPAGEAQAAGDERRPMASGPGAGLGRRKQAVARVRLVPGSGTWTINGLSLEEYFPNKLHQQDILSPLVLLGREGQFDIKANLNGGGPTGQAGAFRLAIARALNEFNINDRPALKKAGFLTRDARAVERKKAGLHKARRAPQYSKR